jgi:predicted tellurium resistance membrane protein TerC
MTIPLIAFPDFSSLQTWISLITLTFLEIVLSVDNIIFISIAANRLHHTQQSQGRNIGLLLAMGFRITLLLGITWLIAMQTPFWRMDFELFKGAFTGQSLILLAGGIFLIYKATSEIHHKLEGSSIEDPVRMKKRGSALGNVVIQIALINVVFSFDSILTAIGLTHQVMIMMISIVASILIMMAFSGPVGRFVNRHPTIQMLGLSFLILIGFTLIAEGAHLAHVEIAGAEIGSIPKGYLYFAIAFSLLVEMLNIRLRRVQRPVQLHGYPEQAVKEGVMQKT